MVDRASTARQGLRSLSWARATSHLRHEHKCGHRGVPPERRLYFHAAVGAATGAVAANLSDLVAVS
jgi:hypothetical protein